MSSKSQRTESPIVPLEIGQQIEMTAVRTGFQGEGVARFEGFAVFVDGLMPGETAIVKVTEVKPRFAKGEILKLLTKSQERVDPRCPAFGVCGGCQVQHMTYEAQIIWKRQLVVDALERIGHFDAEFASVVVEPMKPMETPWRYRNKVSLMAAPKGQGFIAGFVEEGTHEPVVLSECFIRPEMQDEMVKVLVALLRRFHVEAFNEKTGNGQLRQIRIRSTKHGDTMVVMASVKPLKDGPTIAKALAETLFTSGRVVSVVEEVIRFSKKSRRSSDVVEEHVLFGASELVESILGLDFYVSAQSFLQVNPEQTEVLYQTALEMAELSGRETVVDLYAGIGTLSLVAAKLAGKVIGVENVPDAVKDAKRNSERNGVQNAEFYLGLAEKVLPDLVQKGLTADVVMLDPPRAGCKPEVIDAMIGTGANRIVYVSCNPSTLARDLALLVSRGYTLQRLVPVDLFPQTYHVECVALLSH